MALPLYITAPDAAFSPAEFLRLVCRGKTLPDLPDRELRALVALASRATEDGRVCLDPADIAPLVGCEPGDVRRALDALEARGALNLKTHSPSYIGVTLLWGWTGAGPQPANLVQRFAAQRTQLASLNAALRARTEALALAQDRIATLQCNLIRARSRLRTLTQQRRGMPAMRADLARRRWQAKWTAEWEKAS